jgi:hypothetical protein
MSCGGVRMLAKSLSTVGIGPPGGGGGGGNNKATANAGWSKSHGGPQLRTFSVLSSSTHDILINSYLRSDKDTLKFL